MQSGAKHYAGRRKFVLLKSALYEAYSSAYSLSRVLFGA